MIFSDTEMRELGSGTTYNTHNTTSLIRTLKYVSDILQTEEAYTVKGYIHTHTYSQQLDRYKRNNLKLSSMFFNQLRLISLIVLQIKILFKEACALKCTWDEVLNDKFIEK